MEKIAKEWTEGMICPVVNLLKTAGHVMHQLV